MSFKHRMKKNYIILIGLASFVGIIILLGIFVASHGVSKKTPNTNTNQITSNNGGSSNGSSNGGNSNNNSPGSSDNNQSQDVNNALITTAASQDLGKYLLTSSGYALYAYDGDKEGLNNTGCTGSCTIGWQPYVATSDHGTLPDNMSTFVRTDTGESQYAYKGLALYTFTGDSPGQVTGLGLAEFQLARP